ncbi:hypothetical protein LTR27_010046 [Elasticomyces elasticus]|nr:hypothetical protein LTR27_010046 [Elasticomyces elasticus]
MRYGERREQNFAKPNDFIAERWTGQTAGFQNDNRHLWLALADGLAYGEFHLILAKMLWHFDFELADPTGDWHGSLSAISVWEQTPMRKRSMAVER